MHRQNILSKQLNLEQNERERWVIIKSNSRRIYDKEVNQSVVKISPHETGITLVNDISDLYNLVDIDLPLPIPRQLIANDKSLKHLQFKKILVEFSFCQSNSKFLQ